MKSRISISTALVGLATATIPTAIPLVLLMAMPNAIAAVPQEFVTKGGSVEMVAVGKPSFLKIRGKGDAPVGQLKVVDGKASGEIEFKLASMDTGIKLRNEHMLEKYLEVKKYPTAKLTIKDLAIPGATATSVGAVKDQEFVGQLTLHGVTQPVKGKFTVSKEKEVTAGFKIKLSDYKIDIPEYMNIKVADEVDVSVNIDSLVSNTKTAGN